MATQFTPRELGLRRLLRERSRVEARLRRVEVEHARTDAQILSYELGGTAAPAAADASQRVRPLELAS